MKVNIDKSFGKVKFCTTLLYAYGNNQYATARELTLSAHQIPEISPKCQLVARGSVPSVHVP